MNWAGSRVLVTGAGGFIGSHVVEHLAVCGADVRAFFRYSSQGSRGWLEYSDVPYEPVYGDVRDLSCMQAACEGMDTIIHLAALMSVPYSYTAVQSFIDTNITGTHNVLVAAHALGVRRIVCASSSEVYGTPDVLPITEMHPRRPQSPYAATKVGADALCYSHHCAYGTPVVVVRPFNTYGPRQSTRAIIPHMMLQMIDGREEVEIGNPDAVRDFTFILDTVKGLLLAAHRDDFAGDEIQLGTGETKSIRVLFDMCCQITGTHPALTTKHQLLRPDASEVKVLQSLPAKAGAMLGWHPTVGLEAGLAATYEWLKYNQAKYGRHFYE